MNPSHPRRSARPRRTHSLAGAGLLALALLLAAFVGRGDAGRAQVGGGTVHYSAGWNLVAAPTGSTLNRAIPPYFAYGPTSSDYVAVGPGGIVGGRAVWVYFPTDVDVTLDITAADSTRVQAPADRWILLGDPSTTKTLSIIGADAALGYSPAQGYSPVSSVQPGQGVWVLRHTAGQISLAAGPDNSFEQRISGLQTSLTADPTGQLSYDQATALGSEMVAVRDYADVQAASDDLLSAVEDGLQERAANALPPQDTLQIDASIDVREALAKAQFASASGDTSTADGLVEQAKKSAASSEDDGVSLARGQGGSGAFVFYASAATRSAATPATLASWGTLIRSGMPSMALGRPVGSDFWNVGYALLNGQPVPPAPGQSNPPSSNPPTTTVTVTPATASCVGAKGLGLQPQSGFPGATISFAATGFTPGQVGTLTIQGPELQSQPIGSVPVGQDCMASGLFIVPAVPPGAYIVSLQTPKDGLATASFIVLAPQRAPTPTPTPVPTQCNPAFSSCT